MPLVKKLIPSILLLFVVVVIRFFYLVITRMGELPDEIFIFERIYSLTLSRVAPGLLIGHTIYFPNSEYFYPPLYFFINSVILQAIFFVKGNVPSFQESFFAFSYLFRLTSFVLSLLSVLLSWQVIKKLGFNKHISTSIFLVFALLPTAAIFSNALNFHLLVFFAFSLFIYLTVVKIGSLKELRMAILLGLIVGLSLLINFEGLMLIPFLMTYLLLSKKKGNFLVFAGTFMLVIFLISGWWYVFNLFKYGTFYNPKIFIETTRLFPKPFSFPNYTEAVLKHSSETLIFTAGRTNNLRYVSWGYWVWKLAFLISVVGWLNICINLKQRKVNINKPLFFSLAVMFVLNFLVFLYANLLLNFSASQGRYFFPSLLFISTFWVVGLSYWFKGKNIKYLPLFTLIFLLWFNYWASGCIILVYHGLQIPPGFLGCFNYIG